MLLSHMCWTLNTSLIRSVNATENSTNITCATEKSNENYTAHLSYSFTQTLDYNKNNKLIATTQLTASFLTTFDLIKN
jgi:glutamine cyclotransferase